MAEDFLLRTNRELEEIGGNIKLFLVKHVLSGTWPPEKEGPESCNKILLGGFGKRTLSTANIIRNKAGQPGEFRFEFDGNCQGCSPALYAMGDGTVPLESIKYGDFYNRENRNFYMNESHVELVKDKSFLYNVMRLLLDLE